MGEGYLLPVYPFLRPQYPQLEGRTDYEGENWITKQNRLNTLPVGAKVIFSWMLTLHESSFALSPQDICFNKL